MLKYKCECVGIIVITNEESYTSKCDSLSLESIEFHEKYNGKRVKRGLYLSYTGKVINADINGAINIMRKVVGDSYVKDKIINSGLLFNPIKVKFNINVYKYF
jgi:transposase